MPGGQGPAHLPPSPPGLLSELSGTGLETERSMGVGGHRGWEWTCLAVGMFDDRVALRSAVTRQSCQRARAGMQTAG